jgi:hypothetical protein
MFMRVISMCAHQVRSPRRQFPAALGGPYGQIRSVPQFERETLNLGPPVRVHPARQSIVTIRMWMVHGAHLTCTPESSASPLVTPPTNRDLGVIIEDLQRHAHTSKRSRTRPKRTPSPPMVTVVDLVSARSSADFIRRST